MKRRITCQDGFTPHHGWSTNEAPYEFMLAVLTEGKTPEECEKIKQEFDLSYTRLLIYEYGKGAPHYGTLRELYRAEQEDGLIGFVKEINKEMPSFFV